MAARGMTGRGATARLARQVAGMRFEDVPDHVVVVARHAVLDWLGTTLAGAQTPPAGIMRRVAISSDGSGQATLLGTGSRASCLDAALVNAAAAHVQDFRRHGFSAGPRFGPVRSLSPECGRPAVGVRPG